MSNRIFYFFQVYHNQVFHTGSSNTSTLGHSRHSKAKLRFIYVKDFHGQTAPCNSDAESSDPSVKEGNVIFLKI